MIKMNNEIFITALLTTNPKKRDTDHEEIATKHVIIAGINILIIVCFGIWLLKEIKDG